MSRSKSILLQVAFKEAAQKTDDVDELKNKSIEFYTMLAELHEELGLSLEDDNRGRRRNQGGGKQRQLPKGANIFFVDGDKWVDFREAKTNNEVKAGFPDFKPFDDFRQGIWVVDQDGNPNDEAVKLVQAADGAAKL